jgi:hypothetical protein
MDLERVAKLAKLAASDSGVLNALQDDPARMRKPLQLSEAQVRALISASAFSTARPARTTSQPENAVVKSAELMQFGTLGTLGTLLPPEGSGAFPAPGELPPQPAAPASVAPGHHAPSAPGTPRAVTPSPGTGPTAPQSHVPAATPTAVPRAGTPQTPSRTPAPSVTPSASSQGSGTPAVGIGSTSVMVASNGSSTVQAQVMRAPGTTAVGFRKATAPSGCCCDTGMVAIAAQVSTTAQTTITAITAIAGLD